MLSQSSIPEVKEDTIGYALNERKAKLPQFVDLGPPDLVTMLKYIPSSGGATNASATATAATSAAANQGIMALSSATAGTNSGDGAKIANVDPATFLNELHSHDKLKGEIGTFFYTLGIDTSDPTSIAISLKRIAELVTEQPQVWFGKKKSFQIARISLSTWNSFRKCDLNIIVHIPGTVQMFTLNSNGEQLNIEPGSQESELLWAETFVSGVVRSVMLMKDNYEDGEVQNLVETLIINPLASGEIDSVADTFFRLFPLVYPNGELLGSPCYVINTSRTNNYLVETLLEIVKLTHSVDKCRAMLEQMMEAYPEVILILIRVLLANDCEIDGVKLMHDQLQKLEALDSTSTDTAELSPFPLDYRSELLCIQAEFLLDVKNDFKLAQALALEAVSCTPSEFRPWYLLTRAYIKLNDVENALLSLNVCPMSPLKEKYVLRRVVPFPSEASLHLPLPVDVVLEEVTSLNPQDIRKEHKTADPALVNLAASNLKSTFQLAYKLLTEIVYSTGWEALLKVRSKIFVMEDEYQQSSTEESRYLPSNANTTASLNNVDISQSNEGTSNESHKGGDSLSTHASSGSSLRAKRLCERWLDNLFMLLYEDLKTYTLWQTEQLYFEAQNTTYNKLTFEWELFGLCARRLGHYPEAAKAFQKALSQRFSPQSARKLLEYCVNERQRVRQLSNVQNSGVTSSQIISRINELDITIIDLCVKICCWNHRWYIEFSTQLLESMSVVVQDLGLTKVSNEVSARYPESVYKLIQSNILDFYANYSNDYYDN